VSLRKVSISPGIELAVREAGTGPAVLLLHAFPLSSEMWEGEVAALAAAGMRAIAVDLRGFGGSTVAGPVTTMEQMADDALRLLDALTIERAAVVGLSMGGYVCFPLALRAPGRLRGLVLADTRFTADSDAARAGRAKTAETVLREGIEPLVRDMLLPKLLSANADAATREKAAAIVRRNRPEGAAAALRGMAQRADHATTCAALTIPALVVVGADDGVTPPPDARALAAAIPGARLSEIPRAGHLANLEAPAAFQAAIVPFLAGLPA